MNAHIEIAKRLLTGFQLFGPAMKNYTGLQNPWLFGQRMVSGSTGPEAKRGGSDLKCAPQAGLETTTLRLTVTAAASRAVLMQVDPRSQAPGQFYTAIQLRLLSRFV